MHLSSYANARLMVWAEWVSRRNGDALGYPRQSSYVSLMPRTGFSGGGIDVAEDAMEVERAVIALRVVNEELHQVLIETYIHVNKTSEQRHRACGCCAKTFYNRLGRAQQMVIGYLNDIAAGYPLPGVDAHSALAA